jgi:hypothetical protein
VRDEGVRRVPIKLTQCRQAAKKRQAGLDQLSNIIQIYIKIFIENLINNAILKSNIHFAFLCAFAPLRGLFCDFA